MAFNVGMWEYWRWISANDLRHGSPFPSASFQTCNPYFSSSSVSSNTPKYGRDWGPLESSWEWLKKMNSPRVWSDGGTLKCNISFEWLKTSKDSFFLLNLALHNAKYFLALSRHLHICSIVAFHCPWELWVRLYNHRTWYCLDCAPPAKFDRILLHLLVCQTSDMECALSLVLRLTR